MIVAIPGHHFTIFFSNCFPVNKTPIESGLLRREAIQI